MPCPHRFEFQRRHKSACEVKMRRNRQVPLLSSTVSWGVAQRSCFASAYGAGFRRESVPRTDQHDQVFDFRNISSDEITRCTLRRDRDAGL